MDISDQKYIDKLIDNTKETIALFSSDEKRKQERERMVCAAFLRCLGVEFSPSEIRPMQQDNNCDIFFRGAAFQIRESLEHGRKRGDEYKTRLKNLINANKIEDTLLPMASPLQMTFKELYKLIAIGLSEKFMHYGPNGCATLDALVYVNLKKFLDTSSRIPNYDKLASQGWRSVSLFSPPYSHVIFVQKDAPEFLKINAGQTKKECDNPDLWFMLD